MVIIIGHYQPVLLPGPALVGKGIWTFIVTGEIFQHLAISLWRFCSGLCCRIVGLLFHWASCLEGIVITQRYRTAISID